MGFIADIPFPYRGGKPVIHAEGARRTSYWKGFTKRVRRDRYLLLMLVFPMVFYALFRYGPMYGLSMAFVNFKAKTGIWGSPFVGLQYFEKFMKDPMFWGALRNTVVLNLCILAFCFPAPIILALMLNEVRSRRWKRFAQSVSYMPFFISTVVVCSIVISFCANQGVINGLLTSLGAKRVDFMRELGWFRPIYVISELWQITGWNSIIYLAALSGSDMEVYEAAYIDGASRMQRLRYITLPYLTPTICIMLILAVGGIMDVSLEKVFLLQQPSTYGVSEVIATLVYRVGIKNTNFSYASAIGMFQSLVSMIFIITANYVIGKMSDISLF